MERFLCIGGPLNNQIVEDRGNYFEIKDTEPEVVVNTVVKISRKIKDGNTLYHRCYINLDERHFKIILYKHESMDIFIMREILLDTLLSGYRGLN